MAEIGIFPASYQSRLAADNVTYTILADLQFQSGRMRLHPGTGVLTVGGFDWIGCGDPGGNRLIEIGSVELPTVGVAAVVELRMSGINVEFLRGVRRVLAENYREVEGRRADLYFAVFYPETVTPIGNPIPFFTDARMTAPSFKMEGPNSRTVTLSVEGIFSAKNFAPNGRHTEADQRRRYPGAQDRFHQYVGANLSLRWPT
jgi:hypothetical protein